MAKAQGAGQRRMAGMERSYNGWPASRYPREIGIEPLVVAGESFSPGVRGGDVKVVLEYVAEQFHRRVEPLVRDDWHQADDWGYAYRANANNPDNLSCHASGTAIDANATRHPNGRGRTFTEAQYAEIDRILAETGGVVRHLRGYDEMHFEICRGPAAVAVAADRLRRAAAPAPAPPAPPIAPEAEMFRLIQTTDTDRLYAVSGSKVIHLNWDEFLGFVACGLFENERDGQGNHIADKATQGQLNAVVGAIRKSGT